MHNATATRKLGPNSLGVLARFGLLALVPVVALGAVLGYQLNAGVQQQHLDFQDRLALAQGKMTQQEIVRALKKELGAGISQSYLSQIEKGTRPHLTNTTRLLLARFFKVHPGYLVDDPEGYHTELVSDLRTTEGKLDVWLLQGSERFVSDREVSDVLIKCARHKDTRSCFLLLGAILDTPGLAERLLEALDPGAVRNHRERKVAGGRRVQ